MRGNIVVKLMARGIQPGMPDFQRAYDREERQIDERRNRDRAVAIWDALSPRHRLPDVQHDGSVRFGSWPAAVVRTHPTLRHLVGHLLGPSDAVVSITWREGSDSLTLVVAPASGAIHARTHAIRL